MRLSDLPLGWRQRAEELRRWAAAEGAARALEQAAADLECALRESAMEPLDLDVAAAESGYSRGHLRRMIRDGKVPNAGTDDGPMILRCHLPHKPGASNGVAPLRLKGSSSKAQVARAVASGE